MARTHYGCELFLFAKRPGYGVIFRPVVFSPRQWNARLEKENSRLKRLVAELALDKQIRKDIAEGNF